MSNEDKSTQPAAKVEQRRPFEKPAITEMGTLIGNTLGGTGRAIEGLTTSRYKS